MDVLLKLSMMCFFVAGLVQGGVHSKSISNASQFVFDGSSSGYIIATGGDVNYYNDLTNLYALNLDNGEWTDLPSLPFGARDFSLVLRDSTVYAVGGLYNIQNIDFDYTLILSTKDNMWKKGSGLEFADGWLLPASLNGSIYAIGWDRNVSTFQAMDYNGTWNRHAPSIYFHNGQQSAIAVLNDKLYVLGSYHQDEVYDPSTDTWTAINMTNQYRGYGGIVALNGYIYVIGGANAENERYDPSTGELTYFAACLHTPVYSTRIVTDGEKIFVFGSGNGGNKWSSNVQVYRPNLDLWQSMSEHPVNVGQFGAFYVKELPTD